MIAWVGEATWVERGLPFDDVQRQVAMVSAENSRLFSRDAIAHWRDVGPESCFRYVRWIGARGLDGPRHVPPLSAVFPVDLGMAGLALGQSVRLLGYFPRVRTSPLPGYKTHGAPLVMSGIVSGFNFDETGVDGPSL